MAVAGGPNQQGAIGRGSRMRARQVTNGPAEPLFNQYIWSGYSRLILSSSSIAKCLFVASFDFYLMRSSSSNTATTFVGLVRRFGSGTSTDGST